MHRVRAGTATCTLCHQSLHPDADAVVTPDFLADEGDPFFPFSDATMHRACFVVWDRRKAFIAHFNQVVRRFAAEDGTYLQMTSEGELVQHQGTAPPRGPAPS
jgi:hypothetical protein